MIRAIALTVVVAACVQNPPPQSASGPPGLTQPAPKPGSKHADEVHCHEVSDTGSMFSHTECTTTEEERDRNEDSERVLRHQNGGATPSNCCASPH